jgi:glycosyltransferase involved in cell wall biosynthesis
VTAPATWYVVTGNSDYYWRVNAPAKAIGARVNGIPEEGGFYALTQPNDDTAFPWSQDDDGGTTYPAHEGAAVWTRPDGPRAMHAWSMQTQGIRTVAEVDDNYLADPRQNLFLRANRWGDREQLQHMKAVASMNALIVTTPALRDVYWRRLRKQFGRRRVPPIHVCGNHVFLEDWPERVERDGPVRVGWMGSPAHVWDVDLAWPAMLHARENLGCETIMVGYNPGDPDDFPVETDRAYQKTVQWGRATSRHVPWVKLDGTRRMELPFDIGLAPLVHNGFTMGKSDIKAVEYTIAGAAVIASASPVYTENWKHGETCLIATSPQEMLNHVDLLARKPSLRERLVEAAQQYVREERNLADHASEWREAVCGDRADLQGVQPRDRQVALRAQAR